MEEETVNDGAREDGGKERVILIGNFEVRKNDKTRMISQEQLFLQINGNSWRGEKVMQDDGTQESGGRGALADGGKD